MRTATVAVTTIAALTAPASALKPSSYLAVTAQRGIDAAAGAPEGSFLKQEAGKAATFLKTVKPVGRLVRTPSFIESACTTKVEYEQKYGAEAGASGP